MTELLSINSPSGTRRQSDPEKAQANWGYTRYQAYYGYYGPNAPETKKAEEESK